MKLKGAVVELENREYIIDCDDPEASDYKIMYKGKKIDDVTLIVRHRKQKSEE